MMVLFFLRLGGDTEFEQESGADVMLLDEYLLQDEFYLVEGSGTAGCT